MFLKKFPKRVVAGFSTVEDGSLIDNPNSRTEKSVNNRLASSFFAKQNIQLQDVVFGQQVHSGTVRMVAGTSSSMLPETDGLITAEKDLILAVYTADCLPVVFVSEELVGIAHAGYKGILNGVVENMVSIFFDQGIKSEDIMVGIGPGICGECYEISRQRVHLFDKYKELNSLREVSGKPHVDLKKLVVGILKSRNLKSENIEIVPVCTKEDSNYFSARRNGGIVPGEFITYVGLV